MCGRFALRVPWREIHDMLSLIPAEAGRNVPARHNIAPSQDVPIVVESDGERVVLDAQWGLVPSWAKPGQLKQAPINARGETAREKPMFRSAFHHGRCLVPADAWYEWTKEPDGKQPHLIEREGGAPFAFAAIMSENEASALRSVAIITVAAADSVRAIHDRMPAVLVEGARAAWLDPSTSVDEAHRLLGEVETELVHHPVSRAINNARYAGEAEPVNPR